MTKRKPPIPSATTSLRESQPLTPTPNAKARRTARWARTMVKWLISHVRTGRGWEIVNFTGRGGAESRGIVDLLAIRKDHRASDFPRGDLLEMILIQVKGGGARWPTETDVHRLEAVADRYGARSVVLAEHKAGSKPRVYRLNRPVQPGTPSKQAWTEADAADLFK